MEELADLQCSKINSQTPPLTEQEISNLLIQLPDWRRFDKDGEPRLEKSFRFKDFREALAFTDQVGQAADQQDHHPALLTEWGKVTVTWWTHRIKGLHQNDFIMAAKTDRLYTQPLNG